jgi:hypothetical protein
MNNDNNVVLCVVICVLLFLLGLFIGITVCDEETILKYEKQLNITSVK